MASKNYEEYEKEGMDVLVVDENGKVLHRTDGNEKENEFICSKCPCCLIQPDLDPFDWFCDDDVKIVCSKTGKVVACALRPYEAYKYKPGDKCPYNK